MPVKESFDFLQWTSFPSSLKVDNDEGENKIFRSRQFIPIRAPTTIRAEGMIKVENGNIAEPAWIAMYGYDLAGSKVAGSYFHTDVTVSRDWVKVEGSIDMPARVLNIELRMICAGSGVKGRVATTWFDDLKIYQDDTLIYENKFSNWLPYQIAGAVITAIPIGLYAARRMPKITVPQEWWK